MVFTNLTSSDKDAFFALLDEYFSSRPDLLGGAGTGPANLNTPANRAVAASAVHHVLSNTSPQDAAAAVNRWRKPSPAADASNSVSNSDSMGSSVGRVAAAAAAFQNSNSSTMGGPPRPPPRRSPTSEEAPPEHNKLLPNRKFGDVDLSSGKAMYSSLRHSTAAKSATPPQVAPPTPSAFPKKKTNFIPPPVRRTTTAELSATSPPPPPAPPPRERPDEEPEGEIAEALYDFTSEDPGDLELQAGERVLIVERTSDDWWTGEIAGRRGLVPAAYVRVY